MLLSVDVNPFFVDVLANVLSSDVLLSLEPETVVVASVLPEFTKDVAVLLPVLLRTVLPLPEELVSILALGVVLLPTVNLVLPWSFVLLLPELPPFVVLMESVLSATVLLSVDVDRLFKDILANVLLSVVSSVVLLPLRPDVVVVASVLPELMKDVVVLLIVLPLLDVLPSTDVLAVLPEVAAKLVVPSLDVLLSMGVLLVGAAVLSDVL